MNYFIKQIGSKDCAIACLKMLLAITYKSKKFLYYPQTAKDEAFSLTQIMKCSKKEGVELEGFKYVKKESFFIKCKEVKLVVINENNLLHMVLVKKTTPSKVLIYDPKNGIYWMRKKEFLNVWNGEVLEVKSIKGSNYNGKYKSPISLKYRIASYVLQILSMVFILSAMFFINSGISFYVPVALFTCFAISEIVYKRILIACMKKFDASMVEKVFYGNKNLFKNKYMEMTKFKTLVIGTPIQIINSVTVLISGLIILGINGYLNIINVLGVIALRLLLDLLESKLFSSRSKSVEINESALLENSNTVNFGSRLLEVQDKAYRQATFISFKQYFAAFVTGIICLFYSGFSGEISLNFILFHVFIYLYLADSSSKLLNIYLKNGDYRQSKCLYKYYCNEL